jgi:hypothetical protein
MVQDSQNNPIERENLPEIFDSEGQVFLLADRAIKRTHTRYSR